MDLESKFTLDTKTQGDTCHVYLTGVIDEDALFNTLKNLPSEVIFNWKNVKAINSCGIRNWVNFVKELSNKKISYAECPPFIVRQINMIPSFAAKANIESVYIPYICESCESESQKLLKLSEYKKYNFGLTLKCESCGKQELEFDGTPEQYFAFTK